MKQEKQPIVLPTTGLISISRLAKYLRMKPEAFYYALPDNTPLIKFGEDFEHALINIEAFGMEQLKTTLGVFKAVFLTPAPAIQEETAVDEEEADETEDTLFVDSESDEEEEVEEVEEPEEEEEDEEDEEDSLVGEDEEETVEEKLKKLPEPTKAFYTAKSRKKNGKGKK